MPETSEFCAVDQNLSRKAASGALEKATEDSPLPNTACHCPHGRHFPPAAHQARPGAALGPPAPGLPCWSPAVWPPSSASNAFTSSAMEQDEGTTRLTSALLAAP